MFEHSIKGWLSLIGVAIAFLLIFITILLSLAAQSTVAWPLLLAGLLVGFVSTPFYYYFKARDRQPSNPSQTPVDILGAAGQQVDFRRHKANVKEVKPETVYPWDKHPSEKSGRVKNN